MGIFDYYLKNDSKGHKSLRREFYLSNFAPYTIDKIANLITEEGNLDFYTDQRILFEQIQFGSSESMCHNINGKPNFIVKGFKDMIGHNIFAYKSIFFGNMAISQLHFINDQFIFGVMTIMNNDKILDDYIVKLLDSKYLKGANYDRPIQGIIDVDRNRIIYDNLMYISLKYISGNPSHIQFAKTYLNKDLDSKMSEYSHVLEQFSKKI